MNTRLKLNKDILDMNFFEIYLSTSFIKDINFLKSLKFFILVFYKKNFIKISCVSKYNKNIILLSNRNILNTKEYFIKNLATCLKRIKPLDILNLKPFTFLPIEFKKIKIDRDLLVLQSKFLKKKKLFFIEPSEKPSRKRVTPMALRRVKKLLKFPPVRLRYLIRKKYLKFSKAIILNSIKPQKVEFIKNAPNLPKNKKEINSVWMFRKLYFNLKNQNDGTELRKKPFYDNDAHCNHLNVKTNWFFWNKPKRFKFRFFRRRFLTFPSMTFNNPTRLLKLIKSPRVKFSIRNESLPVSLSNKNNKKPKLNSNLSFFVRKVWFFKKTRKNFLLKYVSLSIKKYILNQKSLALKSNKAAFNNKLIFLNKKFFYNNSTILILYSLVNSNSLILNKFKKQFNPFFPNLLNLTKNTKSFDKKKRKLIFKKTTAGNLAINFLENQSSYNFWITNNKIGYLDYLVRGNGFSVHTSRMSSRYYFRFNKKIEVLNIVKILYISLLTKDLYLLQYMTKYALKKLRIHQQRHYFQMIDHLLKYHFSVIFKELNVRGYHYEVKGKIGLKGKARKRKIQTKTLNSSRSNHTVSVVDLNERYSSDSGAISFKLSLYY